jgi:SAM-dependent methyltransferase
MEAWMNRPEITDEMRRYWDDRARENAVFYVDTTCSYDDPDMARFFETGDAVVDRALLGAPVRPSGQGFAVEIGAGLGRVCKALAPHFGRVVGIDISAEMVRRARELVAEQNVSFEVGDGVTLGSIEDEAADLVLTFTVLQHLPTRDAIFGYLRESARVLRPGGMLVAQWNGNRHTFRFRAQKWWWRIQKVFGGGQHRSRLAPQFLGTPVPARLIRSVLEGCGLSVESMEGEGTLFAWVWARKPL